MMKSTPDPPKEIQKWVTSDKEEFDTKKEAEEHSKEKIFLKDLMDRLDMDHSKRYTDHEVLVVKLFLSHSETRGIVRQTLNQYYGVGSEVKCPNCLCRFELEGNQ